MIWRKYEKLTLLEALKTALSFFFCSLRAYFRKILNQSAKNNFQFVV